MITFAKQDFNMLCVCVHMGERQRIEREKFRRENYVCLNFLSTYALLLWSACSPVVRTPPKTQH